MEKGTRSECLPSEHSRAGRIRSDRMIMLALQCERVRERDPRRPKARVHERRLAVGNSLSKALCRKTADTPEVLSSLWPLVRRQVPYTDGIPAHGVLRLPVYHFMCEHEQF